MAADRNGGSDRVVVLLDTNALLIPQRSGVDIFAGLQEIYGTYEPVVPAEVVHELRALAQGRGKSAAAARFGLTLASGCRTLPPGNPNLPVDEIVAIQAEALSAHVLTNDRKLKEALLQKGLPVIVLRNQKRLELIRK
ncbi:MAG: nucleotide-binding protein [Methanocalculus sp. MSAO_Arc1]|uniref:type II toxin-antitoxin system VapC family toxin n=1 Tax=Methanocalculus TaxID=71151 RepID=UPI000FF1385C|nr:MULTISPECIES: PIN domain-containing protein [unclassified Methanocalculus]MCP1662633.1 rRNA-processing protein FCF1 [Methanocalculus sp. AMF5]RQD80333.1 MAG: nucleotide-binding protein [Methanocalculus sp. MSAO_Arc1]